MKPIENWRHSWRLWSVRLSALGAAVFAFLLAAPDQALAIWNALPPDGQALVPNARQLGLYLTAAALVARLIRQEARDAR